MENQTLRVSTGVLNEIMMEAVAMQQPPSDKGRRVPLHSASLSYRCKNALVW